LNFVCSHIPHVPLLLRQHSQSFTIYTISMNSSTPPDPRWKGRVSVLDTRLCANAISRWFVRLRSALLNLLHGFQLSWYLDLRRCELCLPVRVFLLPLVHGQSWWRKYVYCCGSSYCTGFIQIGYEYMVRLEMLLTER